MSHAGNVRIVIVAVNVAAHSHDQQSHLLIAVKEVALCAVFDRVRVNGAGVDLLDRALKDVVALFQTALIGAENALVFSGEGVAESVLKNGA